MDAARDHGMTVRVMAALVGIKDDKKRDELIQRAITEGLDEKDIRVIKGTHGTRKKKAKDTSARKKPPRRVFMKTLDQALHLDETINEATEAINRLGEVKDKDEQDTRDQFRKSRKKLEKLRDTIDQYLKFSAKV